VQDDLFAKVAELVPGIREEESDDDVDIAAIMARQRQQAERIRQEAASMRSSGCVSSSHAIAQLIHR
jgi:hypothetical protein